MKVKKLTLNKETIRRLTDEELKGVAGAGPTHPPTCATCASCEEGCTECCGTSPCMLTCPGTICQ